MNEENQNHIFSSLLRRNLLPLKGWIGCILVGLGLIAQSSLTTAQRITIEAENVLVVDGELIPIISESDIDRIVNEGAGYMFLGETDGIYLTPEGKSVFPIRKGTVEGYEYVIATSTNETSPYNFLSVIPPGESASSLDYLAFDGNSHLGYYNEDGIVFSLNVDTGAITRQGPDAYEILDVAADGKVLYIAWGTSGPERFMRGSTTIFEVPDSFEGFEVIDYGIATMNPAGDVYNVLFARSIDTGYINLLLKNGSIIETGDIQMVWPYLESEYILFMGNGEVFINGTEKIENLNVSTYFIVVNSSGDIYFLGPDGIYFYDADADVENGELPLVLLIDETDINLTGIWPIGETSRDELIFVGKSPEGSTGLYRYRWVDRMVEPLLIPGDEVEGREITQLLPGYSDTKLVRAYFNQDQVIVEARLSNPEFPTIALLRIDLYPPDLLTIDCPEGDCGGDWHTRTWVHADTLVGAGYNPGSPGREDVRVISENINLTISAEPVSLRSLSATGSLSVSQPLTLLQDSIVNDLTINADFTTNGSLTLTGDNTWSSGAIKGSGIVTVGNTHQLTIAPVGESLELSAQSSAVGTITQASGMLNLIGSNAKITVQPGGAYDLQSGSITGASAANLIENKGYFFKSTTSNVSITADFENFADATVDVMEGTLQINGEAAFNDTSYLKGEGSIQFVGPTVTIGNGDKLYNQMDKTGGGATFDGGVEISGGGILENVGKVTIRDGSFNDVNILNQEDGLFIFENDPNNATSIVTLNSGIKNDGNVEQTSLIKLGAPSAILNYGTWQMKDGAGFELLDGVTSETFDNKESGELLVNGTGESIMTTKLTSAGRLFVDTVTFKIQDDATFNSPGNAAEITLSGGGHLWLQGDNITFEGDKVLLDGDDGGGTLHLESNLDIKNAETTILSNFIWETGDPEVGSEIESSTAAWQTSFSIGDENHNVTFQVDGSGGYKYLNHAHLKIAEGSKLIQNGDWNLSYGGEVTVDGEMIVNGGGLDSLFEARYLHLSDTGSLTINDNIDFRPDVVLDFDPESHITVKNYATYFLAIRDQEVPDYEQWSKGYIDVEANATLVVTWIEYNPDSANDPGAVPFFHHALGSINILGNPIGDNAHIKIGKNADFHNLLDVAEDFLIIGGSSLFLDGATMNVAGDFTNLGNLAGNNGIINLGGNFDHNYSDSPEDVLTNLLLGNLTLNGITINNHAIVDPGFSSGTITINGDFVQTDSGTLKIELFGTEPGTEYDQLIVNGTATLGGTLRIIPVAGIPAETIIEPVVADSVSGNFDRVIVEAKSARSTYTVTTSDTGIQMSPTTLNVSTFTEWQNSLFSTADVADEAIGLSISDPDEDGISNLLEYAFDLNPWIYSDNPMSLAIVPDQAGSLKLKVSFPWAKGMTDVNYLLQVSSDLETWTNLNLQAVDTIDEGTHDLITLEGPIALQSVNQYFVRFRVEELN